MLGLVPGVLGRELGPQGSAAPETYTRSLLGLTLPVLLALGGPSSKAHHLGS